MKVLVIVLTIFAASTAVLAQKGIDSQTEKIKSDSSKTTRSSDATRSFDWGKGKTKVRERLANPYQLNSRRDVLITTIQDLLRENKMVVDEASSRLSDGVIVTQPFTFARGAVVTETEIKRYATVDYRDSSWSRGQYSLTIEVQSIDGIKNNVSVTAKVEGRSTNSIMAEWRTLPSTGLAEDEFLAKLVETVTGISPDDNVEDTDQ